MANIDAAFGLRPIAKWVPLLVELLEQLNTL